MPKKAVRQPIHDPIKQRLAELFAGMPFVAPDVAPAGSRQSDPAASASATQAPQLPLYFQAPFYRHAPSGRPSPQGQNSPGSPIEQSFEIHAAGMALMHLDGRLARVNPAFCRLLGYPRSELVGAGFQPLVHPADLKIAIQAMRAMLLGAVRSAHIELRLQRQDGAPAQVELHLALLPDANRKPAFFSILALEIARMPEPAAPASEALLAQPPAAAQPAPDASEWQPELATSSLQAAASQPDQSARKPQWLSGEDNYLGDEEFPEVVYLPSTQTRAVKAASPASRRDLAMHEPAVETVGHPTAPLAALAIPGQSGTGIFARPWERLSLRLGHMAFAVYLLLYLAGIALAELVTTFANPQLGLVIHGGLLVLIFLHASIGAARDEQRFLLTLTLAPLIRLLSLSMPLLEFQFLYWYMLIGAPLFLSVWLVFRLTGYTPRQVGLSLGTGLPLQIAVALTGLVFGYLEYVILKPAPLVESFSLKTIWLPALILLVFTGFLEELIFRGLMQRASMATIRKLGPLYISLLFAVLHIGYRSLADFVFVFFVGFFFSLVAERTRSLLGVTLAHGLTNISLFLIFPFLSS